MFNKGVKVVNGPGRESSIPCQCRAFKGQWEDSTHDCVVIGVEISLGEEHFVSRLIRVTFV